MARVDFFDHARGAALLLVGLMLALTAASTALLVHTLGVRLRRDVVIGRRIARRRRRGWSVARCRLRA